MGLHSLADVCAVPWWAPAGQALVGLALVAFVAAAWCGASLLLPARRSTRRPA